VPTSALLTCLLAAAALGAFCYLQHSVGVNLTVSCPKTMVGRVIGKGGDTIKGLQRKYHTSIQVGSQVRTTKRASWAGEDGSL
jgi:predicted PilT family ATPase